LISVLFCKIKVQFRLSAIRDRFRVLTQTFWHEASKALSQSVHPMPHYSKENEIKSNDEIQ
jgi:hypothetical protein